jgi:hypothetical protein
MRATGAVCRLEHQGPTSHEVGMRENLTRILSFRWENGYAVKVESAKGISDVSCQISHRV